VKIYTIMQASSTWAELPFSALPGIRRQPAQALACSQPVLANPSFYQAVPVSWRCYSAQFIDSGGQEFS
jgi:hypothetical protein